MRGLMQVPPLGSIAVPLWGAAGPAAGGLRPEGRHWGMVQRRARRIGPGLHRGLTGIAHRLDADQTGAEHGLDIHALGNRNTGFWIRAIRQISDSNSNVLRG